MRTLFGAADGTAYRFELPMLGPPPPGGDKVEVSVAYIEDSNSHLLCSDEPLCQHLAHPRLIFHNIPALQVVIEDVLWLLPMTKKKNKVEAKNGKGKAEVKTGKVKAERWLLNHCEQQELRAPPSPPGPPSQEPHQEDGHDFKPRCYTPHAHPFEPRSRMPPPTGYGPLSSRTSKDPNMVATLPVYANRDDESEDEWDDLTIEEELPLNVALKRPIKFIRYVDVLPASEPFPEDARLVDRRLALNDVWAVDQDLQTMYITTQNEPGSRMRAWKLLTTPGLGFSGAVEDGAFYYSLTNIGLDEGLKQNVLKDGPARLKLLPLPEDWACQPTSASPAASYIINNYRIVIDQEGVRCDATDCLAQYISLSALKGFEHLAELASAERAPGNIIYAQRPYWYGQRVLGVGVRLRDGGSRFHLERAEDGKLYFELPGDRLLHSKWGAFTTGEELEPELKPKTIVRAELRVTPTEEAQAHDVIFRVPPSGTGDYRRLEYVLRPLGSYQAIKHDEWQHVHSSILDPGIICLFVNLAKVTWGCRNRDLLRPQQVTAAEELAQAMAPDIPESPGTNGAASPESASKKPRLE